MPCSTPLTKATLLPPLDPPTNPPHLPPLAPPPQGVVLKLRYSRAGHLFEFPILLSASLDPRVIALAYTLIPLLGYVAKDWVIGPLGRLVERRKWVPAACVGFSLLLQRACCLVGRSAAGGPGCWAGGLPAW